jgi:hypothetical protein
VGTISTNEVCRTANDVTEMQIQSGDNIRIKPGSYVCTMDHIISADESETIEVKIKTMDWAREITDSFHYGNKEVIHQAVQGFSARYNGKFDPTILLEQLDQLRPRIPTGHSPRQLHFPHRHLPLEMLPPDQRRSDTQTTNAVASHRTTAINRSKDCTYTSPEASQQQQQSYLAQQCHSDQHQLGSIKTCSRKNPQRRGEISETIYL